MIQGPPHILHTPPASAQIAELRAVAAVFKLMAHHSFHLYTDSHDIARALQVLETVAYIDTANTQVQELFSQVQRCLHARVHPCYVGHIRAHSGLLGPLAEGNSPADRATHIVGITQLELAQQSHALHHQNSQSLHRVYNIPREAACQIVRQCATRPEHQTVPYYGINPRGLKPNQLWQMDVTHIPEVGKLRYVHVTIDTYSGFLIATAQPGEATKHVISNCLRCFAMIGQPSVIKNDHGSGYTSQAFQRFCSQLSIMRKTGIPYNPQGQGIVERAHGALKNQLNKIEKGDLYLTSPKDSLNHALLILNFFNCGFSRTLRCRAFLASKDSDHLRAGEVEGPPHRCMERP